MFMPIAKMTQIRQNINSMIDKLVSQKFNRVKLEIGLYESLIVFSFIS